MDTLVQTAKRPRVKLVERVAFGLDEIASSMDLSTSFVRLEARRGNLRTYRLGKRILVSAEAFKAYLAEREEAAAE